MLRYWEVLFLSKFGNWFNGQEKRLTELNNGGSRFRSGSFTTFQIINPISLNSDGYQSRWCITDGENIYRGREIAKYDFENFKGEWLLFLIDETRLMTNLIITDNVSRVRVIS